jgi:hypothetical protein
MADENKVFISWSGARSKAAAEALRRWLPSVIQVAKPWMSDRDIDKGSVGMEQVLRALEGSRIGIICLTSENLSEEWLNFEAGALLKTPEAKSRVCTFLLSELDHTQLTYPLAMFQWAKADKEQTRKMIRDINKNLDASPLDASTLDTVFDKWWPDLEKELSNLPLPTSPVPPKREPVEMIAEILDLTRAAAQSRKAVEDLDEHIPTIKQLLPFLAQALSAAQTQPPPQVDLPIRKVFRVKLYLDPEIKRVTGVRAVADSSNLYILDEGNRIGAQFANVEQWWPEPEEPSTQG